MYFIKKLTIDTCPICGSKKHPKGECKEFNNYPKKEKKE